MKKLAIALLALLPLSVLADGVGEYVSLRAKLHAHAPATQTEMNEAPSGSAFELAGQITGTADGQAGSMFMMSWEGLAMNVLADPIPDWFRIGAVSARMLVRVEAGKHVGSATLRLVKAISEQEIGPWEAEQGRIAQQKRDAAALAASRKAAALRQEAERPDPVEQLVTYKQAFPQYRDFIRGVNPRLSVEQASSITRNLLVFSAKHGVDPRLVVALMIVESRFNPTATSYKGAQGLGQLMPRTASGMGVSNAYDTKQNIEATVRLVRGHLLKYADPISHRVDWQSLGVAMAAYNAGSGSVKKYGGIPPYKQTQNYVKRVIATYRKLCGK